jgi:hypothetical protein
MIKKITTVMALAAFTLAAGMQSASADVTITFSKDPADPKQTKVTAEVNFAGMAPTGQTMNDIFSNDALPVVGASEDKDHARSLVIRGSDPAQSKKVVYINTGGKATKVEIFHKDLSVRGKKDLNTGFSWVVGDGFMAIDETLLKAVGTNPATFTFTIMKPIAEVIAPEALGKTITNGKVIITSTN